MNEQSNEISQDIFSFLFLHCYLLFNPHNTPAVEVHYHPHSTEGEAPAQSQSDLMVGLQLEDRLCDF